MKDDVPELPDRVPAKRRQVETILDVHIAMWLATDLLTPSERRRLQDEKERRKALVPDRPVGVLVGREGVTPAQHTEVLIAVEAARPTLIHHPGVAAPLHSACKRIAVTNAHRNLRGHQMGLPPFAAHGDDCQVMQGIVRDCTLVIGAPKENQPADSPVWDAVRYARHRSIAVTVILPDGTIYNGYGGT